MPHIHNCELDAEKNWKRGQELIHWLKMMTNPACTKHHLTAVEISGLEAHLPHCIHASGPERKQVDKYHNGWTHKNSLRGPNKTEDLFLPTLFCVHIQSMLVMAATHYTSAHEHILWLHYLKHEGDITLDLNWSFWWFHLWRDSEGPSQSPAWRVALHKFCSAYCCHSQSPQLCCQHFQTELTSNHRGVPAGPIVTAQMTFLLHAPSHVSESKAIRGWMCPQVKSAYSNFFPVLERV